MNIYLGLYRRIGALVIAGSLVASLTACAGINRAAAPDSSPAASPVPACAPGVDLTEADNRAAVCLLVGGQLNIRLTGGGWQLPLPSSDVLRFDRAVEDTYQFTGAKPGTATVTSAHRACPSAAPGDVACHAIKAFAVSVTVSAAQ